MEHRKLLRERDSLNNSITTVLKEITQFHKGVTKVGHMVAENVPVYFLYIEVYFTRFLFVSYRAYVSLDVNNPIMIAYACTE